MPALPPSCAHDLRRPWAEAITDLARTMPVVGHRHPRASRRATAWWQAQGIPIEIDPDAVLRKAALVVGDNTSLMYEAAAVGIPVLAVNAPTYRREMEHGLRFWSHVPGIQCDAPSEFRASARNALDDPPEAAALRRAAAEHVYAHRDGSSSRRAADAIEKVL